MARQPSPVDMSPSPPPQHQTLTKRDVRRNRIMDRLQGMIDTFSGNQHAHYRAQLQAVQVDMTLVLRTDPYGDVPLEDSSDEIRSLVDGVMGGSAIGGTEEASQRDYTALAGKRYAEFVASVNDELEKRDADLVALNNNYHAAIASLERLTQQREHQAMEEHKALSNTIRQRLVATLTKKRAHLLRDKEQLDIADSNALLLHPAHFSINNIPGSPGGGAQNRKTRHLRHRAASPSAGEFGENGKRKRKAGAMEDDGNESPVPGFRSLPPPDALGGGRSPFKDARDKERYTQFEAPAYSLERIFTDKELAMASATAQQATYRYFHQAQQQQAQQAQQEPQANGNANGTTSVPSLDGEMLPDANPAETEEASAHPTTESTPPPSQPAAVEMERQASHSILTRGSARANPLAALSDLATAAAGRERETEHTLHNPFEPLLPSHHAISRSEKSGAPAPPGVGPVDLESDLEMMRRAAADKAAVVDEIDEEQAKLLRTKLLDQALGTVSQTAPYRLPLLDVGPATVGPRVERPSWTGFAHLSTVGDRNGLSFEQQRARAAPTGFGGVAAGGSGSATGVGSLGAGSLGAALQGRVAGGEPMSRTTSAGGSEAGEQGVLGSAGRRGRGRVV